MGGPTFYFDEGTPQQQAERRAQAELARQRREEERRISLERERVAKALAEKERAAAAEAYRRRHRFDGLVNVLGWIGVVLAVLALIAVALTLGLIGEALRAWAWSIGWHIGDPPIAP